MAPAPETFNPLAAPVNAAPGLKPVDEAFLEAVMPAGPTVDSVVVPVTVHTELALVYVEVQDSVVYTELLAEVVDEVEFELSFRTPPKAPPGGEVDVVAFLARAANAANVLPDVGALIAPTIPMRY